MNDGIKVAGDFLSAFVDSGFSIRRAWDGEEYHSVTSIQEALDVVASVDDSEVQMAYKGCWVTLAFIPENGKEVLTDYWCDSEISDLVDQICDRIIDGLEG